MEHTFPKIYIDNYHNRQATLRKGTPWELWVNIAPDANQNTAIPWCESVVRRAVTRLKGHGITLDKRNRYDTVTTRLVPLDAETLTNSYFHHLKRYTPSQSIIIN